MKSAQLNILIETGADFDLPFTVYDDNDQPIDLTGAKVEAQLREYSESPDCYEFICSHNGTGGRITITMPNEVTSLIGYTYGVYDVKVVLADGTTSYPLNGNAEMRAGVTKPFDGTMLYMIGISTYDDLPSEGIVNRLYFCYNDRKIYRWNGQNYIGTAVGNGIQDITYLDGGTYRMVFDDGTYFDFESVPRLMGVHDSTQEYQKLDIVMSANGASYIALVPVPADTLITDTDYWMQITPKVLTIGEVTTVSPTDGGTASIGGTGDAPVLNLAIPRGVAGNESIDDSKGEGDTDYVWSADKNFKKIVNFTEKTTNLFAPDKLENCTRSVVKSEYGNVKVVSTQTGTGRVYAEFNLAQMSDFSAGDKLYLTFETGHVESNTRITIYYNSTDYIWSSTALAGNTVIQKEYTLSETHITSGTNLVIRLSTQASNSGSITSGMYAEFKNFYISKVDAPFIPDRIPVDPVARNLGNAAIKSAGRVNSASDLSDANDAPINSILVIASNDVENLPTMQDECYGTLMTFNYENASSGGETQLFINRYNDLFTRIKWGPGGGTWKPWIKVKDDFTDFSGIEMFERFGVIGDSFASGTIYTPGVTTDREYYPLSWGQILARMSGNVCVNYAKGGYSTYAFVKSDDESYYTYGLGKVIADINNDNGCGLYLLCLGINDSNKTRTYGDKTGGLNYLGTSADIDDEDYTQNANSFWGNYGRIIAKIKELSPKSRIVMVTFTRKPTSATSEAYDAYIEAIQSIAEYFDLPCITLTDDAYFSGSFYRNNMVGYHPTAPQYVGYAKGINRLMSLTIMNNYNYFKEYIGM